jgi:hypothetical protein
MIKVTATIPVQTGCGLRAAGCGLRAAGCGLRAAGCGSYYTQNGVACLGGKALYSYLFSLFFLKNSSAGSKVSTFGSEAIVSRLYPIINKLPITRFSPKDNPFQAYHQEDAYGASSWSISHTKGRCRRGLSRKGAAAEQSSYPRRRQP